MLSNDKYKIQKVHFTRIILNGLREVLDDSQYVLSLNRVYNNDLSTHIFFFTDLLATLVV